MTDNMVWQLADMDHPPRLWLVTETENFLIGWESLREIRASEDFLTLQFSCEFGMVSFTSKDSMRELFEYLQMEKVRRLDGRMLNCQIMNPE